MKIIGHKGAAGYETENTIPSFEAAIAIGCDRAELDVRLTKDGHLVVIYDKEVSKLTNGIGLVSDMALSELKKLEYITGGKIPTFQEVIDVCKNKIDLQIELKADGTPSLVNDVIMKNDLENHVVITSFKPNLLEEIKRINPRLPIGLLFWSDETMADIRNIMNKIPLDFLAPCSTIVTQEFVENAHTSGKKVYAYMVNSKELGDTLMAMGVDEIGTDYPTLFMHP